MVLASRRHCLLFRGTFFRRPRRAGVARHALRNGHGGDFEHHRSRADCADAVRGRQTDRRGRQGAGIRVSAFRRRSFVVDGSGEGAAGAEEAAVLRGAIAGQQIVIPRAYGVSSTPGVSVLSLMFRNAGSPACAGDDGRSAPLAIPPVCDESSTTSPRGWPTRARRTPSRRCSGVLPAKQSSSSTPWLAWLLVPFGR